MNHQMLITLWVWKVEYTMMPCEKNIGMSESSILRIVMESEIGDIQDISGYQVKL